MADASGTSCVTYKEGKLAVQVVDLFDSELGCWSKGSPCGIGRAKAADTRDFCPPPYTNVGPDYGSDGRPRVLCLAVNQNLGNGGPDNVISSYSADDARWSLRTVRRTPGGRILPNGFGPRALAANLSRWVFKLSGADVGGMSPEDVHRAIAYDNYVKCSFVDNNACWPETTAWTACALNNIRILSVLQPDLILCIGKDPYLALWQAVKEHGSEVGVEARQEKSDKTGWTYRFELPGKTCHVGWVYHYSQPKWPNRAWKVVRLAAPTGEGWRPPSSLNGLITGETPADVWDRVMGMDEKNAFPWWRDGDGEYEGREFTYYNRYAKFVAYRVCQALVAGWKRASGG